MICQIGVIEDYYNLIHRHNINNYFLCKVVTFGERNLTPDEMQHFHLSTLKLSYEEAVQEYINRADTRLGKLVANRELPVLHRAKKYLIQIFETMKNTLSLNNGQKTSDTYFFKGFRGFFEENVKLFKLLYFPNNTLTNRMDFHSTYYCYSHQFYH